MTILRLARAWASNPTYIGGASVGVETKTDPGSAIAGNGIYENLPFAAQHLNNQLNQMSLTDRVAFMRLALQLRELRLEGVPITDSASSMAAIAIDPSWGVLTAKADYSRRVTDWSRPELMAALVGIDANVRDMATDGAGNIVAIGANAGQWSYSLSATNGASWTAGTLIAAPAMHRIIYSDNSNRYVVSCTGASSEFVLYTTDGTLTGAGVASSGLAASGGGGGIAVLNAGASDILVICGELTGGVGRPAFRRSTDGGLNWLTGAQAAAGVYEDFGCVVGNGGAVAYHVGTATGGGSLIISAITAGGAGLAMTTVTTLSAPSGATFSTSTEPRILMCQNTGLLVIVAPLSNGTLGLFASLDATDWVGPTLIGTTTSSVNAFALAGGRLFATRLDMLFASDGIGTE